MTNRTTALLTGPAFLLVAAFLSIVERDALDTWGWAPLDHHGVPWPSALTLTSLGWLQAAAFAVTGIALLALAGRLRPLLPAGRSATVAVRGLRLAGAGLVCAALPLDHPAGDPSELASWVGSWHAVAHMAGFVAAAVGGIGAVASLALATRRSSPRLARVSAAVAAVSVVSLALPGALGWYAFLGAFFSWTAMLTGGLHERAPAGAAA
jgi:Protein of unknown function (DUF998)